jgi:predicted ester cyclase
MSTEQNKAIAQQVVDAINRRDLGMFDGLVAPDAVDHAAPPGLPPTRETAKQFIGMLLAAFPDFKYTVELTVAEGDKVAQRVTGSGTMQGEFMGMSPTGKSAAWTEMHISRFANGKLVEHWANVDQVSMMQQLGLMPGG